LPDRWAEFDEFLRSRACVREAHRDCAHILAAGGGFNPRRLRLEFGAGLCKCSCHSSCPVTITTKRLTVPAKTWYTSCICPGAEQERQRLDEAGIEFPDFAELREKAKHRSRARQEAYEAARARAAGKRREEIRDIYVSELNARGLKVPAEPILDAVVERIAGNPLPGIRLMGESLAQIGKALYDLSRLFRQRH
jgi:hypothetical protein